MSADGNETLFKNLFKAVVDNDTEKVQEIHLKKPYLFDYRKHFEVERLLIQTACCNNEEITKVILAFVKSGGDLEEYLKKAISDVNVQLAEFLLKNGAVLTARPDLVVLYEEIFQNTNKKENSTKMLSVLSKYGQLRADLEYGCRSLLSCFVSRYYQNYDLDEAIKICEILLNSGARFFCRGITPLMAAILADSTQLVSLFIRKGANVNYSNPEMLSPLFYAININNEDIVDLLLSNGANHGLMFHAACRLTGINHRVISAFIRHGADVTALDSHGRTAFFYLRKQNIESVNVFIKEFAKLDFEGVSIRKSDMDLIQGRARFRENFEKCKSELEEMSSTQFSLPYSFYSVFKASMGVKKLAKLAKNEELVSKYKRYLLSFPIYKDELERVFEEAIQMRDRLASIHSRLKSTFKDKLPSLVLGKLAGYLTLEDLPA